MASNETLAKALRLAKSEEAAKRVKAAYRKVFTTLNELLETVDEETLLSKLNTLDKGTWLEIVEERYLAQCCGFPTCSARVVVQNSTAKRYRIARAERKIYTAIPLYEKFCSSICYARSSHVEHQLCEEPLWFAVERPTRTFTLTPSGAENEQKRPEDIMIEDADKLLVTRLHEMKIVDREKSSDSDSDGDQNDENAKQREDEQFANEIRSYISSVSAMTTASKAHMQDAASSSRIVMPDVKRGAPVKTAPKTSDIGKQLAAINIAPSNNSTSTASPPKPQFSEREEDEKLARLRRRLANTQKTPRKAPELIEAPPLDPKVAASLAESLR